jgi:hypothetical protein
MYFSLGSSSKHNLNTMPQITLLVENMPSLDQTVAHIRERMLATLGTIWEEDEEQHPANTLRAYGVRRGHTNNVEWVVEFYIYESVHDRARSFSLNIFPEDQSRAFAVDIYDFADRDEALGYQPDDVSLVHGDLIGIWPVINNWIAGWGIIPIRFGEQLYVLK